MLFPYQMRQFLTDFVGLAQNLRMGGGFACAIVISAAELEASAVRYLDPFEKSRDAPPGALEPRPPAAHKDHRARTLSFEQSYKVTVLRVPGEVGRAKTVAAVDKQFGLG